MPCRWSRIRTLNMSRHSDCVTTTAPSARRRPSAAPVERPARSPSITRLASGSGFRCSLTGVPATALAAIFNFSAPAGTVPCGGVSGPVLGDAVAADRRGCRIRGVPDPVPAVTQGRPAVRDAMDGDRLHADAVRPARRARGFESQLLTIGNRPSRNARDSRHAGAPCCFAGNRTMNPRPVRRLPRLPWRSRPRAPSSPIHPSARLQSIGQGCGLQADPQGDGLTGAGADTSHASALAACASRRCSARRR